MAYSVNPSPRDRLGGTRSGSRVGVWATGLLVVVMLMAAAFASSAQAASAPLGTADTFAVLGGSTVTNTGPSVISGDLGLSPGSAVTGFPPGLVTNGTIHTDAVAAQAQADLTTAYNDFAGRPPSATISADLAGQTLTKGVYTSSTSTPGIGLSGDLTLDAQGDPNAVFVFQAKSTLTVGSGSHVTLINGAQPCNVYWQVGSSATIGSGSQFVGNILALTSISLTTGATLNGSALARNGAVALDTNRITKAPCSTTSPTPPVATDTSATTSAGQPVSVVLHGSDTSGAPVSYGITSGPSHGTLGPIDQATGTTTYTPNAGYSGPDSFTYRAGSANGISNTATGTITITPTATSPTPVGTPPTPVVMPTPVTTTHPAVPPASTSKNKAEAQRKAKARARAKAEAKRKAKARAEARRRAAARRAAARRRAHPTHPTKSYGFTG